MNEIALNLTRRDVTKPKYRFIMPVGGVVEVFTPTRTRRKWIEIFADLMAPSKRGKFTHLPGYHAMVEAWSPSLLGQWVEWGRAKAPESQFWSEVIVPLGVLKDMPNAPESTVPVYEAWLFSPMDRKQSCIVTNSDASEATAATWSRKITDAAANKDAVPIIRPAKIINFRTEIGLSAESLAKIDSPDTIVNPRFDKPIASTKILTPTADAISPIASVR